MASTQPRRRVMGPVLDEDPPHNESVHVEGPNPPSSSSSTTSSSSPSSSSSSATSAIGPAPPPKRRVMGPVLDDDDDINSNNNEKKDEEPVVYEGPARPPPSRSNIEPTVNNDNNNSGGRKRGLEPVPGVFVGPARPSAPSGRESDSDSDNDESRLRAEEWESVKRATKANTVKREEWMTELPPERSANPSVLITNRQFSRKDNVTGRGDTSLWTETPADRENKRHRGPTASMKELAAQHYETQKEEANQKFIEEHNKKYRAKTLAEIHQEQLKKKQDETKEEDKTPWKPFDRSVDLEQRVADPKTAAKMIKNASQLNTRFGASSKRFL